MRHVFAQLSVNPAPREAPSPGMSHGATALAGNIPTGSCLVTKLMFFVGMPHTWENDDQPWVDCVPFLQLDFYSRTVT